MTRFARWSSLLLVLCGCVVRTVSAPPGPPPAAVVAPAPSVLYYGEHGLPDGGWCYAEGPHEHTFYPDVVESYVYDGSYYYWRAPVVVTYYAGHPLPGRGWCSIAGPHRHDYAPPRDAYWSHVPGRGYVYRGPYTAARPAPATYWVRAAPAPTHWEKVRSIARPAARPPAAVTPMYPANSRPTGAGEHAPSRYDPRPSGRDAQPPAYRGQPVPPVTRGEQPLPPATRGGQPFPADRTTSTPAAPAPAPAPGASASAPGHRGSPPPGHGGVPPGQARNAPAAVTPAPAPAAATVAAPARPQRSAKFDEKTDRAKKQHEDRER